MFDLKIERLRLNLENAAGHEHRLQPIALRAVTLLAQRLDGPLGNGPSAWPGTHLDTLHAEPLDLNLNLMSDEQAADGIATSWANALTARPDRQN
jgi:hypothetical protein